MSIDSPLHSGLLWLDTLFKSGKEHGLSTVGLASFGVVATLVGSMVLDYNRKIQKVGGLPGLRYPLFPFSLPGVIFPNSHWIPGFYFVFNWRKTLYKRFGLDTISFVSWLYGGSMILTSNVEVMRQIAGGTKSDFIKPLSASGSILGWGNNLLASVGGEDWRNHRRVMAPAFSQNLYQAVWKKTLVLYREMLASETWEGKKVLEMQKVQEITYKTALLVLCNCGFGLGLNWEEAPSTSNGMSLLTAFEIVDHRNMLGNLPGWVVKLPFKYFKEYLHASNILTEWMTAQIVDRREVVNSRSELDEKRLEEDCFTLMVKANEEQGRKYRLSDQELVGNVFILLLAGHETTAQTLAATLAYLSLQPDLQDEIVEQIVSIIGWDRDPEFDQYRDFSKVLAAFYEGIRLYPAGYLMLREAAVDTVLEIQKPIGEEGTTSIPLPKGTMVVVDMIGVQRNERYFDEPEKYKPWRWLDMPHESEVASSFSVGPRACIGRKFATTEAVAMLTMLLRDWKVEPLLKSGETLEQWKDKVFENPKIFISFGVNDAPLRFVRRQRP